MGLWNWLLCQSSCGRNTLGGHEKLRGLRLYRRCSRGKRWTILIGCRSWGRSQFIEAEGRQGWRRGHWNEAKGKGGWGWGHWNEAEGQGGWGRGGWGASEETCYLVNSQRTTETLRLGELVRRKYKLQCIFNWQIKKEVVTTNLQYLMLRIVHFYVDYLLW